MAIPNILILFWFHSSVKYISGDPMTGRYDKLNKFKTSAIDYRHIS